MDFFSQISLTSQKPSSLSDDAYEELRDLIYQKTGLFFPENKKYLLENRVGQRITALKLESFRQYIQLLKNGNQHSEFPKLINTITINETYFFRNEPQYKAFEKELIPLMIKEKEQHNQNRIRIWSAGCSSGEEPYTIAMILREKITSRYPNMVFEIVGTDINTTVLSKAEQAEYRDYSVRKVPQLYLQKYFKKSDNYYQLQPSIKKMVKFQHLNLLDKFKMTMMRNFDVIFCENVLIYFDQEAKSKAVSLLYDALNPGGYLLLGYSEALYGLSGAYKPVHFTKSIAYKKE